MTNELIALLDNYEVGRVTRDRRGRLKFAYTDDWLNEQNAYPISLSMPIIIQEHGHEKIDAFLWGLLPDNPRILDSWAHRFHVGTGSAFKLIAHVGEECAGAIQFIRPERLEDLRRETPPEIEWLTERQIADRLKRLVVDPAAWRTERDTGQFSLAGAQPKTAFLLDKDRWGIPSGRTPTTHIFKPPLPDYEGHAENEHFCLKVASRLGLLASVSSVMRFDDQIAIVIERYDRMRTDGQVQRIHQEDLCQALGLRPSAKYESEGGPGATRILTLLDSSSLAPAEDKQTFVDALALNWLIGGTDAHAKNYSLFIGSGGAVRLAPLYDVISALPYDHIDQNRLALAMRIGGKYRLKEIRSREWLKFGKSEGINVDQLFGRLMQMAESLPDHVSDVRRQLQGEGLKHSIIERLSKRVITRAQICRQMLVRPPIAVQRS